MRGVSRSVNSWFSLVMFWLIISWLIEEFSPFMFFWITSIALIFCSRVTMRWESTLKSVTTRSTSVFEIYWHLSMKTSRLWNVRSALTCSSSILTDWSSKSDLRSSFAYWISWQFLMSFSSIFAEISFNVSSNALNYSEWSLILFLNSIESAATLMNLKSTFSMSCFSTRRLVWTCYSKSLTLRYISFTALFSLSMPMTCCSICLNFVSKTLI